MANQEEKSTEATLQELILNTSFDKYKVVPLVKRWVKELKTKEEFREFSHSQLLDRALKEILSGTIKLEDIEKLPAVAAAAIKKAAGEKSDKEDKQDKEKKEE